MSFSQRPLRRDTRVFISAVSRELGTIRKLVKKGLEDNGYHAVEQDNFESDYRSLVDKLRKKIASCDAVVHLAGQCYGAEPKDRPPDAPRRSYTQLEYDIATELNLPVYSFLTDARFPTDPHDPEPEELRELQAAHRARLTKSDREYTQVASVEHLDQKIRSLQLKVERLEGELQHVDEKVAAASLQLKKRIAVTIVGVGLVLATVIGFGWRQHQENKRQEIARRQQADEFARAEQARQAAEVDRKERESIKKIQIEIAERLLNKLLANKDIKPDEARQQALKELPEVVRLPLTEIQELVDRKLAPAAEARLTPLEHARAALARGDYLGVLSVADKERQQERELAMLEGTAALAQFRKTPAPKWNDRALSAFQHALALANPSSESEWKSWTEAALAAASVLHELARDNEAEPLLRRCIALRESHLGPDALALATPLNNLGSVLEKANKSSQAEALYRRALAIDERHLGSDHPEVATDLSNLAGLLESETRFTVAELLYLRSLKIDEKAYGDEHPQVALRLNNLSQLLQVTRRVSEAEPHMRRALRIYEKAYGPTDPTVAVALNNLAGLLNETNRLGVAEPLFVRSLLIDEKAFGRDHPNVAIRLNNLAQLLQATQRLEEAEPLIRKSLTIDENALGSQHPMVARRLNNLAQLLEETSRRFEAEPIFVRALMIQERVPGQSGKEMSTCLNNLAGLLQDTLRPTEAEPLYRRSLLLAEQTFGVDHPLVAGRLLNLATLMQFTNRSAEAEPLFRRAVVLFEQSLGPEHPNLAIALNGLGSLMFFTNRPLEAELLCERAVQILARFQQANGHEHPHSSRSLADYRNLLRALKRSDEEIAARIKSAQEVAGKLEPFVPVIEKRLGPARPVAEVFAALDAQALKQGRPAAFLSEPKEPISPHLEALLRPNGGFLFQQGLVEQRAGRYPEAIAFYTAAIELLKDPASLVARLQVLSNRAAAYLGMGLVEHARDELRGILTDIDRLPDQQASLKGRARYHLARCEWRLGHTKEAIRLAEASLGSYAVAARATDSPPAVVVKQSDDLLSDLKAGKTPPPLPKVDALAAIEAARRRYQAREALRKLPLDQKAGLLLDEMLGPAKSIDEVCSALEAQYRKAKKPAWYFQALDKPIAPAIDALLGPEKPIEATIDGSGKSRREAKEGGVWSLPLNEPISPRLDELLGPVPK